MHIYLYVHFLLTHSLGTCFISRIAYKSNNVSLLKIFIDFVFVHSQVHVVAENTTTFATLCPFADLQLFYMSFFCVPSFDFCFYFYSTFIALSPELYRFNICLTPATKKKQILSGLSCKYSNPNGSSPKSQRKNVCRLPNPNRQVRKGVGATNIHFSSTLDWCQKKFSKNWKYV